MVFWPLCTSSLLCAWDFLERGLLKDLSMGCFPDGCPWCGFRPDSSGPWSSACRLGPASGCGPRWPALLASRGPGHPRNMSHAVRISALFLFPKSDKPPTGRNSSALQRNPHQVSRVTRAHRLPCPLLAGHEDRPSRARPVGCSGQRPGSAAAEAGGRPGLVRGEWAPAWESPAGLARARGCSRDAGSLGETRCPGPLRSRGFWCPGPAGGTEETENSRWLF